MSKVKTAEIYTELINISRELGDTLGLTILQLEILCIVFIKKEQGYNINPSDIYNLTNYRYRGEIYKQTKALVTKEYLVVETKARPKRDKKYYSLSGKGMNAIQKILEVI